MVLTRREIALALALLTLAGAALFGWNVAHGGFVWDDWASSANVRFAPDSGLFGALDHASDRPAFGYRPVLVTLLTLAHWTLGSDQRLFVAMAALFGVLTAWALFVLLRSAGLTRLDAAVPAALLLAFPWADSTRLWAAASFDTLAVALYLLGATLAVRALRRRSRALTAASLVLYLAACWTYEIVAAAVLASPAIYLAVAPRRASLKRFALDAAVVAIALVVVVTGTTRDPQALGDQIDHAGVIASQAFSLLARALVPVGAVPGAVGAALLALIAGATALLWRHDQQARRWLAAAGIGALGVVAGYALFVPALPHYQPLAPGTANRINVLAAVGYAVLVYALARLATLRLPALAAPLLCAAIGVGYVAQTAGDERDWQRSHDEQARVLAALPHDPPAHGTRLYTFNARTEVADGVPAFSLPFDLRYAVQIRYGDESLAAYPVADDTEIHCLKRGLHPSGGTTFSRAQGARYGSVLFVDVPTRRVIAIGSRAQCRRWRARLGAGAVSGP